MKFFGISKDETVLFVCVQNAGRSQIAEAFFRKYAPNNYEALSAGTEPAGNLNPLAIEAMKEVGIDISRQRPKIITEDIIKQSTARVNMLSESTYLERFQWHTLILIYNWVSHYKAYHKNSTGILLVCRNNRCFARKSVHKIRNWF